MLPIDKGLPMPAEGRGRGGIARDIPATWQAMQIGDSFLWPSKLATSHSIRSTLWSKGIKGYRLGKSPEGYRVWKTKEG